MIFNSDGMEGSIASIRELLSTSDLVELFTEDYASETEEFTEDAALRKTLKMYACEDDDSMDTGQFVKGITKAVWMDIDFLKVTRISFARLALKRFLKENHLELKSVRGWNDGFDRLVVNTIMKAIHSPFEWRELR